MFGDKSFFLSGLLQTRCGGKEGRMDGWMKRGYLALRHRTFALCTPTRERHIPDLATAQGIRPYSPGKMKLSRDCWDMDGVKPFLSSFQPPNHRRK
jgi:hypothetical protein